VQLLNSLRQRSRFGINLIVFSSLLIIGCGGGGGSVPPPSISIQVPTEATSYATTQSSIGLGGTISNASFVHVLNSSTGFTTEGYVNYNQGYGSWFADVYGLGFGDNLITVTADADGTGVRTANAHITIIRPLQPAELIINGPDQFSAATYWTCMSSFNESHKIALFGDGTGRSTTGLTNSAIAGTVVDFTWSYLGPDSIIITNCSNCSFQKISRIQGSLSERYFYGQIETVGGAGDPVLDYFSLIDGNL
jgi:hypothetical protein